MAKKPTSKKTKRRTVAQAWAATQPNVCSQNPEKLAMGHLDPKIRRVVTQLLEWGYATCDSGDGESKAALGWKPGSYIPIPHVFMTASPCYLSADARKLMTLVEGLGLSVGEQNAKGTGIWIDATYDPKNDIAIIGLFGLNDTKLP